MSNISLTASMRSNLLSLQNTQKLMDTTQERLSTGNKVNSAIDNPSSYYTAQSLNNRASDLSSLLDSMGQAISTIKAADEGIEAITSFVEQAKAVASSALDATDAEERNEYMAQFNAIRDQIDALAKDSGYKGVNLINGDDLTVTFNETRTSSLTISGQDGTTKGLGLDAAAGWAGTGTEAVAAAEETLATAQTALAAEKAAGVGTEGTDYFTTQTAKDTAVNEKQAAVTAAQTALDNNDDDDQTATLTTALTNAQNALEKAQNAVVATKGYATAEAKATAVATAEETVATAKAALDTATGKKAINDSIDAATDAISKLRTMSSELGNNYSIVQTREDFTENLINVLEEGADKLTLADMNEESANMLALQTRQQLAINSLSLASQAAQSVLKLF